MNRFEWDEDKNRANIRKHGVSFAKAQKIFNGPVFSWLDDRIDYGEDRYITLGVVDGIAVLVVVHTDEDNVTRIISARPASKQERKKYYDQLR